MLNTTSDKLDLLWRIDWYERGLITQVETILKFFGD